MTDNRLMEKRIHKKTTTGCHTHDQTTPQDHPCLCNLATSCGDNFGATRSVKQNARIFYARDGARQRRIVDTSPCPLFMTPAYIDIRRQRAMKESVSMTSLWKRSHVTNAELWTPMTPRSLARTHTNIHTHTHTQNTHRRTNI
jgi:hypothetical protein